MFFLGRFGLTVGHARVFVSSSAPKPPNALGSGWVRRTQNRTDPALIGVLGARLGEIRPFGAIFAVLGAQLEML